MAGRTRGTTGSCAAHWDRDPTRRPRAGLLRLPKLSAATRVEAAESREGQVHDELAHVRVRVKMARAERAVQARVSQRGSAATVRRKSRRRRDAHRGPRGALGPVGRGPAVLSTGLGPERLSAASPDPNHQRLREQGTASTPQTDRRSASLALLGPASSKATLAYPKIISYILRMPTAMQRVSTSLRQEILSGAIPPGSRLIIRDLAIKHDTSDIPVREALRSLEGDGLVEVIPYRGARVVTLSIEDIQEGCLIRGHLESLATSAATGRLTEEDFVELEDCMSRMKDAIDKADNVLYSSLNREFHGIIFGASPHRRLQQLIESLSAGQSAYQMQFGLLPGRAWTSYREHRGILDALRSGDADRAAKLALEHKLSTAEALTSGMNLAAASRQPSEVR